MSDTNHLEPASIQDGPNPPLTLRRTSRATQLPAAHFQPAGRQNPEAEISLRFFLNVIEQWWKVATPIAVLLAIVSAGLVLYFFQPMYEAAAWLQIEDKAPFVAFESKEDSKRFAETQVELIRSPLVLGPVVSKSEVAGLDEIRNNGQPIEHLAKKIQIRPMGNSELFRISWASADKESSAKVVNAVIDSYFKLRTQDDLARARRVIELLEEEKSRRAHELSRQRENVRRLSKQLLETNPLAASGGIDIVVMDHPLKELRERLTRAEVDRNVLEVQLKALEEAGAGAAEIPELMVHMRIEETQEIQDAKALIANKRAMMQRIQSASKHGENDPAYRRLAREIERYEMMIEVAREEVRPDAEQAIKTLAGMEREGNLASLRTELDRYRITEELMRERYQQQLQELGKSGGQSLNLEFARAELHREEEVFDMIAKRATSLKTEMGAPGRVTLMQRAVSPELPLEEIPWKHLAMSILASLCLPFGVAALWERSLRRISSAEELEQQTELAVVGEVSKLPLRRRYAVNGSTRENGRDMGLFEESIDSLRTGLVLAEERQDVQVLAVASAISGEGKTSVASQLAVSIARSSGKPTLLIDADMRAPDIHRIFHPEDPGLAQVLDNTCSLEDAIVTTWSDHVHLLPSGELHKSPHKLLGNDAFKSLLDEARLWYRYIIVDTPPVLSASESLAIAKQADGTLICTMRDVSRASHFRLAYDRLIATGSRPVGAVLNGVPARRYASTYGSYGYSK